MSSRECASPCDRYSQMTNKPRHDTVFSLAFREALLHMRGRGLSGAAAYESALKAAARVSARLLGRPVSPREIAALVTPAQ